MKRFWQNYFHNLAQKSFSSRSFDCGTVICRLACAVLPVAPAPWPFRIYFARKYAIIWPTPSAFSPLASGGRLSAHNSSTSCCAPAASMTSSAHYNAHKANRDPASAKYRNNQSVAAFAPVFAIAIKAHQWPQRLLGRAKSLRSVGGRRSANTPSTLCNSA